MVLKICDMAYSISSNQRQVLFGEPIKRDLWSCMDAMLHNNVMVLLIVVSCVHVYALP
jgi:hypothetical protein